MLSSTFSSIYQNLGVFWLPKHPFIRRSFFIAVTSHGLIRVLLLFSFWQNGRYKKADNSRSFLNNKWLHHDITAVVKGHKCFSSLFDFLRHVSIFRLERKTAGIWILPIYSTIWRPNDVRHLTWISESPI